MMFRLPWSHVEQRPDVQAYLSAFDAYLAAGGSKAPACVADLKGVTLAELVGGRKS